MQAKDNTHTPIPWTTRMLLHVALKDDVEFALRAVNNHESLLAALDRAEEALEPSVEGETEESCHPQIWNAYHGARAALASAKGPS